MHYIILYYSILYTVHIVKAHYKLILASSNALRFFSERDELTRARVQSCLDLASACN
jgi:hypothetical protein